jgi:exodeoxyribonuclease-1
VMAQRWQLDLEAAGRHAAVAAALPDMSAIWPEVFKRPAGEDTPDVDQDLYGGFVGNADRRRLDQLRSLSGPELAHARTGFDDGRLEELVFRYRARNFADTLAPEEQARWEAHRRACLLEGEGGALNLDCFFAEIDTLSATADARAEAVLGALYEYAEAIAPEA